MITKRSEKLPEEFLNRTVIRMRNYTIDYIVRFEGIMEGIGGSGFISHWFVNFAIDYHLDEMMFRKNHLESWN